MKKVLITGACGAIVQRVLPGLAERFELTLLDIRDTTFDGTKVPGVHHVDLLENDRTNYRDLFRGHDAVIHSGFVRADGGLLAGIGSGPDRFWNELDNVRMSYNVMQACVEAGVGRLVSMSSNHAADYYEGLIHTNDFFGVTHELPAYSDNYYGWAKISYEALGFLFATGKQNDGKQLPNIQVRIGAPRDHDLESIEEGDLTRMRRALGAWISVRDEVQLLEKCITTPDISDENGIPFQIVYGISRNSTRFWDISHAKRVLGYEPQDDALVEFRDHVHRITGGAR
jgi:nucleoside-diphosphate-sugar epimerase